MTTVDSIRDRQRRLQKRVTNIRTALGETGPNEGKTIGFKVPDDLRERIMAQKNTWGVANYKRTIVACLKIGLLDMEEIGKLLPKEPDHELPKVEKKKS